MSSLSWLAIVETRGSIGNNPVNHWQVTVAVGFLVTSSECGPPGGEGQRMNV
ncbi:MAG: dodecin domain-containing protein [Verrucomicrobiia bacterium]